MPYDIPEFDSKVFIDKFEIDVGTMKQIKQMIAHKSVVNSRFMPDCHRGSGCCIGFTFQLQDTVVPNFIGGDIGCGILAFPIGKETVEKLGVEFIEKTIREQIKMGSGQTSIWPSSIVHVDDVKSIFDSANLTAINFVSNYLTKFPESKICDFLPTFSNEWFEQLCRKIGSDINYDLRSLGTLGSGNHYVEVCKEIDYKDGDCSDTGTLTTEHNTYLDDKQTYIIVHSGSKNLGHHVCKYHQDKIITERRFDYDTYYEELKSFRRKCQEPKQLAKFTKELEETLHEKQHPDYLEEEEAYEYFFDMIFAQAYASQNRKIMIKNVLKVLNIEYNSELEVETVHNYIDFDKFIIRKGAVSAQENELLLISLNMRDGSLLCKGKGNPDWNYSTAHGAGRKVMRDQAHKVTSMKQFEEEMKNVYSTTVIPETLDESPSMYKDSDLIIKEIEPSVTILKRLVPIINVKGHD